MDRITSSLLAEFTSDFDITSLPEDKAFEQFTSYISVRRHHGEFFDPSDISVGSGSDTGIDAIAIIVNGTLITDSESFSELANNSGTLDVAFIFVQSERSSSFDSAKIGTFAFGVQDFFNDTPVLPRNSAINEANEIMAAIYAQSSKFKRRNPSCRLYYITTGKWVGDKTLEARRATAKDDIFNTGLFSDVEFQCIGAEGIQKLYSQTKNAIAREFTFKDRIEIPTISGVTQAYLGFLPASEFVSLIKDEDGEITRSIFYDNVRDWQNYNSVNSEIKITLESDDRSRFVLMNNGVTIIARSLSSVTSRFHIEDFQIVNGCQTSHVLFDQQDALDDTVTVPLRLIVTQDESVIEATIKATNRQTGVSNEQFFAMTDFAKQLELYFQSFDDGRKLFYERRSRQYDREALEKTRIVTHKNLVRSFASMFMNEPHRTTRNYASLANQVGKDIFIDGHKLDPYYVSAVALYRLEYAFRSQRLDPKFKPARYHILLATRLIAADEKIPAMNSKDMERYCRIIIDLLWSSGKAETLFDQAADAVTIVAEGNFHRDNIRTQPFTEGLIRHCRSAKKVSGQI